MSLKGPETEATRATSQTPLLRLFRLGLQKFGQLPLHRYITRSSQKHEPGASSESAIEYGEFSGVSVVVSPLFGNLEGPSFFPTPLPLPLEFVTKVLYESRETPTPLTPPRPLLLVLRKRRIEIQIRRSRLTFFLFFSSHKKLRRRRRRTGRPRGRPLVVDVVDS